MPRFVPTLVQGLLGEVLYDRDRHAVGTVEHVYVEHDDDRPEWALVRFGDAGSRRLAPPASAAHDERAGLPYGRAGARREPSELVRLRRQATAEEAAGGGEPEAS